MCRLVKTPTLAFPPFITYPSIVHVCIWLLKSPWAEQKLYPAVWGRPGSMESMQTVPADMCQTWTTFTWTF